MKYLILVASMMIAVPVMASSVPSESDWANGSKSQDKAGAYVACAFFGDMTSLGREPDEFSVHADDVDKFRIAALKEYRTMNKYYQL